MPRVMIIVLGLLLLLPLASAQADGAGSTLNIKGSSTMLPILQALREVLEQELHVHLHLEGGGSLTGLEALQRGTTHLAMVSRNLTDQEKERFDSMVVALDGVAVIINSANVVAPLSKQQLVEIFQGKSGSWEPYNGRNEPIYVLAKDQNRSTREVFDAYFGIQGRVRATRYVGSNTEMIVLVGTLPRAIGYVSIGTLQVGIKNGVPVRAMSLEGVDATMHAVASGEWPMTRELNLVWPRNRAHKLVPALVKVITSARAREVIIEQGFVTPSQAAESREP